MPKKRIRVLVTAGPTREYLDPTRFISNPSSGKMGYLIAQEARKAGLEVTLISGPTYLEASSVKTIRVVSAKEMFEQVKKHFDRCDVLIMTAAVADYRPKVFKSSKIKKKKETLKIEFEKNPDILAWAGRRKGARFLIGFAAETDHVIDHALKKLESKHLDVIVANQVGLKEAGFESDHIKFALLDSETNEKAFHLWKKTRLARKIIQHILQRT
jgi:phosphopantothenoylcysteine decarboxylase/phosphopantothenate--cysteine ligase